MSLRGGCGGVALVRRRDCGAGRACVWARGGARIIVGGRGLKQEARRQRAEAGLTDGRGGAIYERGGASRPSAGALCGGAPWRLARHRRSLSGICHLLPPGPAALPAEPCQAASSLSRTDQTCAGLRERVPSSQSLSRPHTSLLTFHRLAEVATSGSFSAQPRPHGPSS